ncbi:hypothetical protein EW146_g4309 [Bondarzewia mesenterica]|uniref:CUE domain-containing protein n=1 Tax=Bondarzewia mesenterica TaxID=1095465 RepID=A0A4S4LUX8_9AGAM|nr:hypothetical protein EW146_g4309 [Bondarzewia mesenterica]
MGEVVNVIVAFAVIIFIFRWATAPGGEPSPETAAARTLRFRPKNVTPEMVHTISEENIHYDLLRTGSVELTSNRILERGFLDPPPPPYFTLYPRSTAVPPNTPAGAAAAAGTVNSTSDRVKVADAGTVITPEEAGGRALWEDTAEKREESLKERKARMVLAARQRMLAQRQKSQAQGS